MVSCVEEELQTHAYTHTHTYWGPWNQICVQRKSHHVSICRYDLWWSEFRQRCAVMAHGSMAPLTACFVSCPGNQHLNSGGTKKTTFLCVFHMALIVCTRAFILARYSSCPPHLLVDWSVVWSRNFRLREQRPPSVHFLLHRGCSQGADLFIGRVQIHTNASSGGCSPGIWTRPLCSHWAPEEWDEEECTHSRQYYDFSLHGFIFSKRLSKQLVIIFTDYLIH